MGIRPSRRAAGVLVVAAMVFGLGSWAVEAVADAGAGSGDAVALEQRHLPTAVNAPGTWSSAEPVRWPVAALGISTRTETDGLFDEKESLGVFAVSAVDGSASWIRLPGFSLKRWDLVGGFNVSPDGEWVGWVRPLRSHGRSSAGRVAGWSVMNTTTGQVRRLDVPGFPWVRATMSDLAFSGDSRYLLTSFEAPNQPKVARSRGHQFVAWDVEDATSRVLEEPGPYWLPNLGSAPTGVVWARGRQVFRVDPATNDTTTLKLPQNVITASWGPDDVSFAYIGRPSVTSQASWRLYAGRTVAEARRHPVDLPADVDVAQLLGWRDATHVVVGHYRRLVHVVDVVTGDVEDLDLSGYGTQVNVPVLAEALWQQPLLPPVGPDGTTDPRAPWRWFGGALLVLFAGALLVLRWRGRRHPRSPRRVAAGELPRVRPAGVVDPGAANRPGGAAYAGDAARLPSLRPLASVATGLVLVLVDVRVQGVDLVPDPVGWVVAALALSSLGTAHRGFSVAGVVAWWAVLPSVPEWFGVESPLLAIPVGVALLGTQYATCTAVMAVSPAREATASAIRGLSVVLAGAVLLTTLAARAEPSWEGLAFVIGLAYFAVTVWFLVLLYGAANGTTQVATSPLTD